MIGMRFAVCGSLILLLIPLGGMPVWAQETPTADEFGEELGFDDVEAEPPHDLDLWGQKIHFSGRFDINLEMTNLGGDGPQDDNFRNSPFLTFRHEGIHCRLDLYGMIYIPFPLQRMQYVLFCHVCSD